MQVKQNYNNYMEAITRTINKHAPLITKTKTKKDHNPWFGEDSQRLKPNVEWLKGGGSNQKIMKTSWNTSASILYTKSTYTMPRRRVY